MGIKEEYNMQLSELISKIKVLKIYGDIQKDITGISYDSRKASKGDLFICKGVTGDGHEYAEDAYIKGIRAFIIEKEMDLYYEDAAYILTQDTKVALSCISRVFFDYPDEKIYSIGITGTKGKTTTTYFVRGIFKSCDIDCGLIGTIHNFIGNKSYIAERTTPESYEIQKMLNEMIEAKTGIVTMEVSSHALRLGRVDKIKFDIGIFTNLSQDHLDFHEDMEDYFQTKTRLFDNSEHCIINIDDEYGKRLYEKLKTSNKKIYKIGLNSIDADFRAYDIKSSDKGTLFKITGFGDTVFSMEMFGDYNIYNALSAITAAYIYGIEPNMMEDALLSVKVPGRQEKYDNGKDYSIIIDYAHSPASLKETLEVFRSVKNKRLIVLFGAGGDRDKTKRPLMGRIAAELADFTILTSDNPRTEVPEDIINEIETGTKEVKGARYVVICNRIEAIKYAVQIAEKDDIIILAGKGHETYQEIDHVKQHLDEREVLDKIYEELN